MNLYTVVELQNTNENVEYVLSESTNWKDIYIAAIEQCAIREHEDRLCDSEDALDDEKIYEYIIRLIKDGIAEYPDTYNEARERMLQDMGISLYIVKSKLLDS